jgi:hypothetical protein
VPGVVEMLALKDSHSSGSIIPFHDLHINKPKARVTSEGNHVIITPEVLF